MNSWVLKNFIAACLGRISDLPSSFQELSPSKLSVLKNFVCTKYHRMYHRARAVDGCFEERPDLCFRFWLPPGGSTSGPDQVGTAVLSQGNTVLNEDGSGGSNVGSM